MHRSPEDLNLLPVSQQLPLMYSNAFGCVVVLLRVRELERIEVANF